MRTVLLLLLATGCLKSIGPDVGGAQGSASGLDGGDGGSTGCSDADSDPNVEISFNIDLKNGVFNRNKCNNCHTSGGDGLRSSGFDVSTYVTLRTGGGKSRANIVIDGMPCASILYQKVGPSPPFGRRMPKDRSALSDVDLQLVHDWIAEGAHDN